MFGSAGWQRGLSLGRCIALGTTYSLKPAQQQVRWYRHRGAIKLICEHCRYKIRAWHIPVLTVDCSKDQRHKQALTKPAPRARQFPTYLLPHIEGKQYGYPKWRSSTDNIAHRVDGNFKKTQR